MLFVQNFCKCRKFCKKMKNYANEIPVCVWYQWIKIVLTDQKYSFVDEVLLTCRGCAMVWQDGCITFGFIVYMPSCNPKIEKCTSFFAQKIWFFWLAKGHFQDNFSSGQVQCTRWIYSFRFIKIYVYFRRNYKVDCFE